MQRYTDRDCYAAMVRAVASMRLHGRDLGVSLPDAKRTRWAKDLERFAADLGVPVRRHGDAGERLVLDHAPSCYGGGVRPMIEGRDGRGGQGTPSWWIASAGLGPGALPPKMFCYVLSAVERALEETARQPAGL